MPNAPKVHLRFTPQLERFLSVPKVECEAVNVESALRRLGESHHKLLAYLVDDNFKLRTHVAVFLNGNHLQNLDVMPTKLSDGDELFFMQALSGG